MKFGCNLIVGKREEEYVALSFTPHWFAFVVPIGCLLFLYFLMIPFVFMFDYAEDSQKLFILIFLSIFLVYAIVLTLITVNYNVYQISNRKVFNSRIVLPSKIKETEVMLSMVQTFSSDQSSLSSQLFDYGTVKVGLNMSGDKSNMTIRFAPKPQKILEIINTFEK